MQSDTSTCDARKRVPQHQVVVRRLLRRDDLGEQRPEPLGLDAGRPRAHFLVVHAVGHGGLVRRADLDDRAERGIAVRPVVVAVGAHELAVEAHVDRHLRGDDLQIGRQKVVRRSARTCPSGSASPPRRSTRAPDRALRSESRRGSSARGSRGRRGGPDRE